jgi:hypothetical protein
MKQTYEVERIARAERMLADHASATLEKLVHEVAATCGISIQEMLITLRPDSGYTPEPKAHFVITGAEFCGYSEREEATVEGRGFVGCLHAASAHRQ